jgi:cytidyltransferase-like protein
VTRPFVSGAFDTIRSRQIRFLEEAARLGPLTVLLWPDGAVLRVTGKPPTFPLAERRYFLESLRFVDRVEVAGTDCDPDRPVLPLAGDSAVWAVADAASPEASVEPAAETPPACAGAREGPSEAKTAFCREHGIAYRVIGAASLAGFAYDPPPAPTSLAAGETRVIVTGCFDWLHTGHVRFFEEASAYGELNVVIGSDANVRLLKGRGHPLFAESERRYVVGAVRNVARCLVATGSGWLDAEPEIRALGIGRYVVNEDGDRPEKRRYCEKAGIEYIVLKRRPKEGLPSRSSTALRGF